MDVSALYEDAHYYYGRGRDGYLTNHTILAEISVCSATPHPTKTKVMQALGRCSIRCGLKHWECGKLLIM